jgi:signal transduction histidine kinase
MNSRRVSIRLKLLASSALLLLAIFSLLTLYLLQANTKSLRGNLEREAQSFAALATGPVGDTYNLYADSGTANIQQVMRTYLDLNKNITNITLYDTSGTKLYSYHDASAPKISIAQANGFKAVTATSGGQLQYEIYPYFSTSGAHPYTIAYSVSNDEINASVRHEVYSLLVAGIATLLLTTALTYILINRIIVSRIRQVSQQASIISSGQLEQQITVRGNDEVTALGDAVNNMAQSLKNNITQLQEIDKVKNEFMAITSHNLRTPLTIINGYLESMDSFKTVEQLQHGLERIGDSVKRLGNFAEDVLTISSIELNEPTQRETVALDAIVQKIADQAKPTADLSGVHFEADIRSDAFVQCNPPYVRSAIWNLIDNALKFTPKDGTVNLSVTSDGTSASIAVSDTGIGIARDEIPKLFTKFHRATSVTTYDYEGTGIGLYATKIIITQQGGTVSVTSELGKGSTFTITLPIAPATAISHNDDSKAGATV